MSFKMRTITIPIKCSLYHKMLKLIEKLVWIFIGLACGIGVIASNLFAIGGIIRMCEFQFDIISIGAILVFGILIIILDVMSMSALCDALNIHFDCIHSE